MRLFDLHCDTLACCYEERSSLLCNTRHWELRRARRYAPLCQVFEVWIPDTKRGAEAFRYCKQVLGFLYDEEKRFPQQFAVVTDAKGLTAATDARVCAAIPAVEGGAALGGNMHNVCALAGLGVRVMTLTWNGENELGYGCLCPAEEGLTPFGTQVVKELDRHGIITDVSHLNEHGFWDVVTLSDRPFIASHSVSRAVCDYPRNLSDAQFKEIARRGGLVGLNFDAAQLGEQTFETIYRHLSHYCELGGEYTVAWGGDLDGTDLPDEWCGVAVYEELLSFLLGKGFSQALLDRLFFENAFNFFASTLQTKENAVQ